MLYLCRCMRTCRVLRSSNRISLILRSSFNRENFRCPQFCPDNYKTLLTEWWVSADPYSIDQADRAGMVHIDSVCVNHYGYTNCLWTVVCMPATVHIVLRISRSRGNNCVLVHTLGYCDMRAHLLCSDQLRLVHWHLEPCSIFPT